MPKMPETEPYLPESCLFHPSKREVRRPRPEFIHHGDFPEFCHPEQSSPLPFRPAFLRVGRARSRRICGFLCDHADSDGPQIPRLGPRSASRQKQAGRDSGAGLARDDNPMFVAMMNNRASTTLKPAQFTQQAQPWDGTAFPLHGWQCRSARIAQRTLLQTATGTSPAGLRCGRGGFCQQLRRPP